MSNEVVNLHQDIIDRCIGGSRDAQYELYKLYSKAMYNTCVRMLNDADDADDVLQEAFISAFRNLKSYRGDASFGAWLKRIVVNKCITFIKKNHGLMVPLDERGAEMIEEEQIDYSEVTMSINKIKEGVKQLPDGFRSVLTMYLFEGLDHKEIAEVLGITESTSKSQYLRAKLRLRTLLEDQINYG
ncbi:MAG: RNA polymerase sigma factor [Cyclobacteriaceae bacterium]